MRKPSSTLEWLLLILFSPLAVLIVVVVLALFLAMAPFYLTYRLGLRIAFEIGSGRRGRRIVLVYSRSPVWQDYVERNWLPRLRDHAIVLNWSDRATWEHRRSLAVCVFHHWAPDKDLNPMAILFPRFRPVRRIGFFYAFRDWKHGKDRTLREAEDRLFTFADRLRAPHQPGHREL